MYIRHLNIPIFGEFIKLMNRKVIPMTVTVFLLSCTNPVTLNFRDFEEHTTVNGLLTPDSVVKVHLTQSLQADLEEIFQPVKDAGVSISGDQVEQTLQPSPEGVYTSAFLPASGKSYHLKIIHNGRILTSVTTVPSPFSVMIKPKHAENMINITLQDPGAEKNAYWIGIKHYEIPRRKYYYDIYLSSNYLLLDDFNRIKKDDADPENTLRFSFHFFARLDDVSFNGREVSFDIFYHWPDSAYLIESNEIAWLSIINADLHLDKYMKAAIVQYELNATGDFPVFATPVSIYSNIRNGKGIFGSYTSSVINLNKFNK